MSTTLERLLATAVSLLATACTTRNSDDTDGSTGAEVVESTTSDGNGTTTEDVSSTTEDASTTTEDASTTSADATTSSPATDEDGSGTESTGGAGESSTSESTGAEPLGNCCELQASGGCDVPAIEECVCNVDPYCCNTQWDLHCVFEVGELGCGECPSR